MEHNVVIEFLDYCKLNDNRIEMIKKNLNIDDLNVNDRVTTYSIS